MKSIVYMIVNNGIDGMMKTEIDECYTDEQERDQAFQSLQHPEYYRKEDQIVDLQELERITINKLNALERMILDIPPRLLPRKAKNA